jgi:hypothetical protein
MSPEEVARIVGPLRKAQELLGGSTEAAESLLPAVNVSFFLLGSGHAHNFEDYVAGFRGTALPVLGVFASREDFNAWLKAHVGPPPRGAVGIAGERYTLGYSREQGLPLLLRLPPVAELRRPGNAQEQGPLWLALDRAQEVLKGSPEDVDALHSAALALHFVQEAGCTREFARFLAHFDEPRPPLCSFATREEADTWLKSHPSPPNGASVKVGEDEFTVGYRRESDLRLLVPFPKYEEFDDVEEDESDEDLRP